MKNDFSFDVTLLTLPSPSHDSLDLKNNRRLYSNYLLNRNTVFSAEENVTLKETVVIILYFKHAIKRGKKLELDIL